MFTEYSILEEERKQMQKAHSDYVIWYPNSDKYDELELFRVMGIEFKWKELAQHVSGSDFNT